VIKKSEHTECVIGEATDTELHPDNINREEGSKTWKPLIQTPREQKKVLSKEK
jgi:hypothetical protein